MFLLQFNFSLRNHIVCLVVRRFQYRATGVLYINSTFKYLHWAWNYIRSRGLFTFITCKSHRTRDENERNNARIIYYDESREKKQQQHSQHEFICIIFTSERTLAHTPGCVVQVQFTIAFKGVRERREMEREKKDDNFLKPHRVAITKHFSSHSNDWIDMHK